jgi:hypothetical protein
LARRQRVARPHASELDVLVACPQVSNERTVELRVRGRPLEDVRRYSVGGRELMLLGGEPMGMIFRFRRAHDIEVLPRTMHEALGKYLGRWRVWFLSGLLVGGST